MTLSLYISFLILLIVSTATATNGTTTDTVGWVGDPNGRGTLSLVISSLLTLGLCVWSAMHLNIPPRGESEVQLWIKNLKWGLVGVVAPELVVFAAWRQYNSAKALHDILEIISKENQGYNSKDEYKYESQADFEPRHRWTMVHSFYAGMGGFVVEPDGPASEGGVTLTVSARGIDFLARCGHLPNIGKDDIKDKSKADGLAKALVCVQAGWMVVQILGRVFNGLPVTLLEVNTLGHVLCALVIYLLWWYKPRMVREPTKIEGDWVAPLCAYMYMSSKVSGSKSPHAGLLRRTWFEPELSDLAFFAQTSSPLLYDGDNPPPPPPKSELNDDAEFYEGHFGPRPLTGDLANGFAFSGTAELAQVPSATQVARWQLAADAVQRYPTVRKRFEAAHSGSSKNSSKGITWFEPTTEELLTKSSSNWPEEELLRGTEGLIMGIILWCASMAYGAVHIAAWNDHFPSSIEKYMWRISAIYIAASGLLWLLINLLAHFSKTIDKYWDGVVALQAHWTSYLVLGFICSVCGVAYAVARIFLVVEAFISIRKLPVAAYQTPDWTQNIPHL